MTQIYADWGGWGGGVGGMNDHPAPCGAALHWRGMKAGQGIAQMKWRTAQAEAALGGGEPGEAEWFVGDHLGSIRGLTGAGGSAIVGSPYDYSPYGQPLGASVPGAASSLTSYGYTGQWREALTGLQYHRARWLDPGAGRWLSPDPVFDFPGNYGHPYAYVGMNPLDSTDPTGTSQLVNVIGTAALVGSLAGFSGGAYFGSKAGFGLNDKLYLGAGIGLVAAFVTAVSIMAPAKNLSASTVAFLSALVSLNIYINKHKHDDNFNVWRVLGVFVADFVVSYIFNLVTSGASRFFKEMRYFEASISKLFAVIGLSSIVGIINGLFNTASSAIKHAIIGDFSDWWGDKEAFRFEFAVSCSMGFAGAFGVGVVPDEMQGFLTDDVINGAIFALPEYVHSVDAWWESLGELFDMKARQY